MPKEPSVFTKILNGQIPSEIIYQDEVCFAIFDISPIREGHMLVIPKVQIDNVLDLDEATYSHLMKVSKEIASKLKKILEVERVIFIIEGFAVPHVHIHLLPSNTPINLRASVSATANLHDFMTKKGLLIKNELSK